MFSGEARNPGTPLAPACHLLQARHCYKPIFSGIQSSPPFVLPPHTLFPALALAQHLRRHPTTTLSPISATVGVSSLPDTLRRAARLRAVAALELDQLSAARTCSRTLIPLLVRPSLVSSSRWNALGRKGRRIYTHNLPRSILFPQALLSYEASPSPLSVLNINSKHLVDLGVPCCC